MSREVYSYTIKFKLEVVNALLNRKAGTTVAMVAKQYGLGKSTLDAWQTPRLLKGSTGPNLSFTQGNVQCRSLS